MNPCAACSARPSGFTGHSCIELDNSAIGVMRGTFRCVTCDTIWRRGFDDAGSVIWYVVAPGRMDTPRH